MLFTIYVGFDIPVTMLKTTGAFIPYKFEVFLGLGLLIFIINLRRSYRRWMGLKIVSKPEKFKWNNVVSKARIRRVVTYLSLEAVVMLFVGIALYAITPEAIYPAAVFVLAGLDSFVFTFMKSKYRVGLSSKALIVSDRDVIVLYFTGLRKVSIHQQTVFFDYIKNLQLSFPLDCIQPDQQEEFFNTLEDQLDRDKVFFSKIR